MVVHPANIQVRDGAKLLLPKVAGLSGALEGLRGVARDERELYSDRDDEPEAPSPRKDE